MKLKVYANGTLQYLYLVNKTGELLFRAPRWCNQEIASSITRYNFHCLQNTLYEADFSLTFMRKVQWNCAFLCMGRKVHILMGVPQGNSLFLSTRTNSSHLCHSLLHAYLHTIFNEKFCNFGIGMYIACYSTHMPLKRSRYGDGHSARASKYGGKWKTQRF